MTQRKRRRKLEREAQRAYRLSQSFAKISAISLQASVSTQAFADGLDSFSYAMKQTASQMEAWRKSAAKAFADRELQLIAEMERAAIYGDPTAPKPEGVLFCGGESELIETKFCSHCEEHVSNACSRKDEKGDIPSACVLNAKATVVGPFKVHPKQALQILVDTEWQTLGQILNGPVSVGVDWAVPGSERTVYSWETVQGPRHGSISVEVGGSLPATETPLALTPPKQKLLGS